MTDANLALQAERLDRRRARMLPVLGILFLSQQASYFTRDHGSRSVDHVHIAAWLILSIVLLLALATGGGWFYPRAVRELANDEATRANRGSAFQFGFFATMIACIGLYVWDLYQPLAGRDAVHLVMTVGIAAALLRYAMSERHAVKNA